MRRQVSIPVLLREHSSSTWTDALRTSSFPQNWTIFYWAYWMVWCVAPPFFIDGREIRFICLL
ncbi:BCCT family transporter [Lachnospiraceae bacterium 62-26]